MRTIEWRDGAVRLIDQRQLPGQLVFEELHDYQSVARAIREMWVRGAPAIGAAAAFGLALAAAQSSATSRADLLRDLESAGDVLRQTRPTAVNLGWAIDRVLRCAGPAELDVNGIRRCVLEEAQAIADEDVRTNQKLAEYGSTLIFDGDTVIHHCNTGPLAAVDIGTALGAVIEAHRQGKRIHVLVDETRPRLQGARLTAWELMHYGVPMTLIVDSAAGQYLRRGIANACFVGADRIAANGDTANKIGTYSLAVVARENAVPFYVVAPMSTIDMRLASGDEIPIEERSADEVTCIEGVRFTPEGVAAGNPAFDVTPHRFITAIVTEKGIVYPPFDKNLARMAGV